MKAVIFDMNGVIINDERFHQQSWRVLINRNPGVFKTPTEDEFKHDVFGRSERSTLTYLLGRDVTPEELEAFSKERVEVVKALFSPLVLADNLKPFLDQLQGENVPIGIATGSRPNYANHILDGLGLRPYIKTIVTADDIKNSKPDPEIYLQTAQKMDIEPENCVVFEDTISGIRAARAAGMYVIAIASTHRKDELTLADEIIGTFGEVRLAKSRLLRVETPQAPFIEGQNPAYAKER